MDKVRYIQVEWELLEKEIELIKLEMQRAEAADYIPTSADIGSEVFANDDSWKTLSSQHSKVLKNSLPQSLRRITLWRLLCHR